MFFISDCSENGNFFKRFVRFMLQTFLGFSIKIVHTLYYRRLSGAPQRSPDLFLCGFPMFFNRATYA